jgi:hypothetical protein
VDTGASGKTARCIRRAATSEKNETNRRGVQKRRTFRQQRFNFTPRVTGPAVQHLGIRADENEGPMYGERKPDGGQPLGEPFFGAKVWLRKEALYTEHDGSARSVCWQLVDIRVRTDQDTAERRGRHWVCSGEEGYR